MLRYFASQEWNLKNDILSGITVALALVPEAVAFAFVAGVSPVIGLYSAFFLGIITAICGGRPGMISGATGAMAVIVVSLVARHGIEYLFPTVILCGLIQIVVGLARLGMLIRMVPHSVMLGFVNGLAIVIFMAQFGSFKTVDRLGKLAYLHGPSLWIMLGSYGPDDGDHLAASEIHAGRAGVAGRDSGRERSRYGAESCARRETRRREPEARRADRRRHAADECQGEGGERCARS